MSVQCLICQEPIGSIYYRLCLCRKDLCKMHRDCAIEYMKNKHCSICNAALEYPNDFMELPLFQLFNVSMTFTAVEMLKELYPETGRVTLWFVHSWICSFVFLVLMFGCMLKTKDSFILNFMRYIAVLLIFLSYLIFGLMEKGRDFLKIQHIVLPIIREFMLIVQLCDYRDFSRRVELHSA